MCSLDSLRLVAYNRSLAENRMDDHLKSWIVESDFAEISKRGFNSVRLPVGYWNVVEDPYDLYAPRDYRKSLQYIDWVFDMATKYNLTVMLDLHGAPGSQNGIDHSGCSVPPTWGTPLHRELSLVAIEAMAKRYGNHPKLLGIELLNEPGWDFSTKAHMTLVFYYDAAYKIIRKYNSECWVIINEIYDGWLNKYPEFQEPDFYNVMMDYHLYNWQEPYTKESAYGHLRDAAGWSRLIDSMNVQHPVIIGEWCMSTGTFIQVGQPFVDTCVQSFDKSFGWYMWNWKIQRGLPYEEWDVQLQGEKKHGLDPFKALKD